MPAWCKTGSLTRVSTTLFYICIAAKLLAQSKLTRSLADKIVIESNLYPGFDRGVVPRVVLALSRLPDSELQNRDSLPSFAVSLFRNLDLQL